MKMRKTDIPGPGSGNSPFRVPEGYFDNLTECVMARLPEAEVQTAMNITRRWHWLSAYGIAAALLLAFLPYAALRYDGGTTGAQLSQTALSGASTTEEDVLLDYLMTDNIYIYDYATETE